MVNTFNEGMVLPNLLRGGSAMHKFISAAQVARRLNVTARTVVRWIREGKLPGAFQVNPDADNSPFLIPIEAIEEFIKTRPDLAPDVNDGKQEKN